MSSDERTRLVCGICGVLSIKNKSVNVDIVKDMVDILAHRGPDDSGYLFFHTGTRHNPNISFYLNLTDEQFKKINPTLSSIQSQETQKELHEHDYDLFLGFRRLAILDLSSAGHQPFSDLSKNIWLVFNGEIYNYLELKNELKNFGHRFKSKTDTEVIVYAFVQWGIECIKKFNGMFAFALYDNFRKKLYLVRDRCGIKPLYWTLTSEGDLVFASEIKSILAYKKWNVVLDQSSLLEYFTFQNFFTTRTLYKDIFILEPGKYLQVDLLNRKLDIYEYWDFDFFSFVDFSQKEQSAVWELRNVLESVVKRQLISDVEVGSYLSGGIDTGLIVAFASKFYKPDVLKTFTIGFDMNSISGLELGVDERKVSEYVSYLFSTEHYEMVLKAGDMERCFEKLVYHLEEPRVGQSYPNFFASKLASKFVKVVLGGVGGDELFGGYIWRYMNFYNSSTLNEFFYSYYKSWQRLLSSDDLSKTFKPILKDIDNLSMIDIFISVFRKQLEKIDAKNVSYEQMLLLAFYFEVKTFLHGLLVVEDKLSMAHSLEERVPFLDNEIIDLALKIPPSLKILNNKLNNTISADENLLKLKHEDTYGKYILRVLTNRIIGNKVSKLKKQGFTAPDSSWFRGESIKFVKRVLLSPKARIYNFMDRQHVSLLLEEHFSGKKNRRLLIWSLLYFEYWLKIYAKL